MTNGDANKPKSSYRLAFISPRWRKVLRDLGHNKVRTLLVIFSIAVGVFAIGMIVSTQIMLSEDMALRYNGTNPASAELYPGEFDMDLVQAIRRMDSVAGAEGRRSARVRLQVGPDEWKDLSLDAIEDYDDIRINKITPVSDAWPPPKKELLIERNSLALTGANVGDTITIETPDGKIRQMRIAGVVHDMNKPPAQFVGRSFGYVTFDTMEWLGLGRRFDELYIRVAENRMDKDHIRAVADEVEAKIEKGGGNVYWTWIPEPGEHPANETIEPMLLILGVLGALSLFLSGFLVANIISALLTRQIKQIGIMKALGARTIQLLQMYLVAVIIFGLLALLIAIPLGGLAAYKFAEYIAGLVNFDLVGFRIPIQALKIEVAVGLLVPLLAAAYPVFIGVRITVSEATSTYGLGKGHFGAHIIDRMVEWATGAILGLSRPMRIAFRNAIRRKARLVLTLFTLTLGGAIFIAVMSVHSSLLATLDDALSYWNYDVDVKFAHSHRIKEIEQAAMQIPGVAEAESWVWNTARRLRPDEREGPNFSVVGVPASTNFIQPTLVKGRWLHPDDANAIVINTEVLKEEPDIEVGDDITLTIEGREQSWRVVGLVKGVMTGRVGYVNYPYFARALRYIGRSSGVQIIAAQHDPAFQTQLAKDVKAYFDGLGMQVSSTETTASTRETIEYQFNILIVFLSIMAVLIAVVGALGLMGTMSINVMERTREIGVMRAVGASDGAVAKIVIVEGLFIGLLSWLIGAILGWPIGKLLSDTVGTTLMETPLSYRFSFGGVMLWLAVILVLSTLASLLPARNASRLTIRETLAYE